MVTPMNWSAMKSPTCFRRFTENDAMADGR